MVLVHVITFKGHHKFQDRWENREYVEEKWPYPDVPVYVVCPKDGEGHSQILHRNYLLPSNSNLGQGEKDAPMAGIENNKTSTPVPPVDSEPADAGLSGMVTHVQQVVHSRVVQIKLLHIDVAPKNLGLTSMEVSEYWFTSRYQATQYLGCMPYQVCTTLSGEVQCEYTLLIPLHVCKAPLISALREILSM